MRAKQTTHVSDLYIVSSVIWIFAKRFDGSVCVPMRMVQWNEMNWNELRCHKLISEDISHFLSYVWIKAPFLQYTFVWYSIRPCVNFSDVENQHHCKTDFSNDNSKKTTAKKQQKNIHLPNRFWAAVLHEKLFFSGDSVMVVCDDVQQVTFY